MENLPVKYVNNSTINIAKGVDLNPQFYQQTWEARPKLGIVFIMDMFTSEMLHAYMSIEDPSLHAGNNSFKL